MTATLTAFLQKMARPVRFSIEAGLAILLAVLVARLAWLLIAPQASVATLSERALPTPLEASTAQLKTDRRLLVEYNPFGEVTTEVVPDAPETNLNLKLGGTFASTGRFGGSAQITTPDNRTKRYVIGDEIIANVTLERIFADRVLITRNGESETLLMGGRGTALSVIGAPEQVSGEQDRDRGAESNMSPAAGADIVEGVIRDPDALLRVVSPSLKIENGRQVGYVLQPRSDVEAFNRIGLKPGDILIEVNGTIATELDIGELRNEIGAGRTAVLTILRDGILITLRLSFEA